MTLTEECKQYFEDWYLSQDYSKQGQYEYGQRKALNMFNAMMLPFRWGVYVDFFDVNGIYINSGKNLSNQIPDKYNYVIEVEIEVFSKKIYYEEYFNSLNDSRTAAIEKANEIYNSQ